ncbi:MAG: DUF2161 family putative PD-(D/E)XK-type phosphodiesterase [Paracoccaceae bacterium]
MSAPPHAEAELYAPIKAYLESQGYEVKGEVGPCDILAMRGEEEPVAVEIKLAFSLQLVMQGVARQALFENVYIAVPASGPRGWKLRYRDITALCRRLGLGLIAVRFGAGQPSVETHLDPAPYAPRRNAARRGRLLREFAARAGDPNIGGTTGVKRVTAYRQDALRLARHMHAHGPTKIAEMARATGAARAGAIVRDNHYGWFERVARGVYGLTPAGAAGLDDFADQPAPIAAPPAAPI